MALQWEEPSTSSMPDSNQPGAEAGKSCPTCGPRPSLSSSAHLALQLCAHSHIDRERLRRRNRAVVEQHVRYRDRDRRLRIEESAESRELAIEQVVYEPVDLQLLRERVRAGTPRGFEACWRPECARSGCRGETVRASSRRARRRC